MSSSSPPHPQNIFEYPFNFLKSATGYNLTVGKYINRKAPELVCSHSCRPTEDALIWKPVLELVDSHREMPWLVRAAVQVPVILWQEINVVEDGTSPVVVLHCFHKAHVHQHCPVECVAVSLVDQVDAVVELLLDEHGMEVVEEDRQLWWSVPVWHNHCHLVVRAAVQRLAFPPLANSRKLGFHLSQGKDTQVQRYSSLQARRDFWTCWKRGGNFVRGKSKVGKEGRPD